MTLRDVVVRFLAQAAPVIAARLHDAHEKSPGREAGACEALGRKRPLGARRVRDSRDAV